MIETKTYSSSAEMLNSYKEISNRLNPPPQKVHIPPIPTANRMEIHLRKLCRDMHVSFDAVVSPSQQRSLTARRHRLVYEMSKLYPDDAIARLFNRDRMSIMYAIKKGREYANKPPRAHQKLVLKVTLEEAEKISRDPRCNREIAAEYGISHTYVSDLKNGYRAKRLSRKGE